MLKRFFGEKFLKALTELKSTQIIAGGYMGVVLVGTLLLALPAASYNGRSVGFLNALFTSASAACVTGLAVVNTFTHWTAFGKIVILLLIEIGGMGFMVAMTMLMVVTGKRITIKDRLLIRQSLNQDDLAGLVRLTITIVLCTLVLVAVGTIILSFRFFMNPEIDGVANALWLGLFHAVSALNNAGVDVFGGSDLRPYVSDFSVNVVILSLILLGSQGYTVWLDVVRVCRIKNTNLKLADRWRRLTLHSKMALYITAILTLTGAVFFFVSEYGNPNTLGELNLPGKIWASIFMSISQRTAGFNTVEQTGMEMGSNFMTILLMFIGGSPGGTAGGVKTVTVGVVFASVISLVRGKSDIEVFNRRIPIDVLKRSVAVILFNLSLVIITTLALCVTEKNSAFTYNFLDLLFEATSAVGTVGLTRGITPYLSSIGKILIIICMYVGRVGPVTVALALSSPQRISGVNLRYPEEKIFVG